MQPSTLPGLSFLISAFVTKQFSEFPHLASTTVAVEAGAVGIPLVVMAKTNPVRVRVAIDTDVHRARIGALVVAAGVIFYHVVCSLLSKRRVRRESVQVQTLCDLRVFGKQARKIPPRPRRGAVWEDGRISPNQRPPFHLGSEQSLANLWSCTHA